MRRQTATVNFTSELPLAQGIVFDVLSPSPRVAGQRLGGVCEARHVQARLFTDGGARGNPGPAAAAFVLEAEDGTVLDARGVAIGVATNNVAEYTALV